MNNGKGKLKELDESADSLIEAVENFSKIWDGSFHTLVEVEAEKLNREWKMETASICIEFADEPVLCIVDDTGESFGERGIDDIFQVYFDCVTQDKEDKNLPNDLLKFADFLESWSVKMRGAANA